MAQIAILERKCARCGLCAQSCPFGAIELRDGLPTINEACRACGACVRACPQGAVLRLEARAQSVDKSQWRDILVFAEVSGGRLHPVALDLIGKARELAAPLGYAVKVALIGSGMEPYARELQHYGPSEIAVYDDPALDVYKRQSPGGGRPRARGALRRRGLGGSAAIAYGSGRGGERGAL